MVAVVGVAQRKQRIPHAGQKVLGMRRARALAGQEKAGVTGCFGGATEC